MKAIVATFDRTRAGRRPFLDWMRDLPIDDAKRVGRDIKLVEEGWPIGMPTCRPLGKGLYEVRSTTRGGRVEVRVYFTIVESLMLLLHHQEGKSGQGEAIALARDRLGDHAKRAAERARPSEKG